MLAGSSQFRKSVDCITGTSAAPPELISRERVSSAYGRGLIVISRGNGLVYWPALLPALCPDISNELNSSFGSRNLVAIEFTRRTVELKGSTPEQPKVLSYRT
jgi:hypothetical protein